MESSWRGLIQQEAEFRFCRRALASRCAVVQASCERLQASAPADRAAATAARAWPRGDRRARSVAALAVRASRSTASASWRRPSAIVMASREVQLQCEAIRGAARTPAAATACNREPAGSAHGSASGFPRATTMPRCRSARQLTEAQAQSICGQRPTRSSRIGSRVCGRAAPEPPGRRVHRAGPYSSSQWSANTGEELARKQRLAQHSERHPQRRCRARRRGCRYRPRRR